MMRLLMVIIVKNFVHKKEGTKFSPVYELKIKGGETKTIYCRLTNRADDKPFANGFEKIFAVRKQEADDFYEAILPAEYFR